MIPHWEERVYRQLAWAAGVPFVDLRSCCISRGTLSKISASVARSRRWIPFLVNRRRVVIVVDDPVAAVGTEFRELSRLVGPPWKRAFLFALAAPSAVDAVLEKYYGEGGSGDGR